MGDANTPTVDAFMYTHTNPRIHSPQTLIYLNEANIKEH